MDGKQQQRSVGIEQNAAELLPRNPYCSNCGTHCGCRSPHVTFQPQWVAAKPWSLWKTFLVCLLACLIATTLVVLALYFVHFGKPTLGTTIVIHADGKSNHMICIPGSTPSPAPIPGSTPSPAPTPSSTSSPAPTTGSTPSPAPTTGSTPSPAPTPSSTPSPAPTPSSTSSPAPTTGSTPSPAPTTGSTPSPAPSPTPSRPQSTLSSAPVINQSSPATVPPPTTQPTKTTTEHDVEIEDNKQL
ncbi:PREDICTED: dynactin-associated protein [Miniopterus natalensis]|uniref:dynactin-associated protein n=1 Tax=Miniopterus natalensis TaxID=291302 RepID=UPI0007A71A6A|nr:PREDICTED: dynactin-associated protein [Miniopterus natalensis]